MELCWDNIENIRLSTRGNLRDMVKKQTYYYYESCKICGEPFLGKSESDFCSNSCSTIYRNKHQSKETRKKRSENMENKWNDPDSKLNTKEFRKKMSKSMKEQWNDPDSVFNSKEYKEKRSKSMKEQWNNPNSVFNSKEFGKKMLLVTNKGYYNKGIPTYDTYAHQIEWAEEVRRNKKDPNVLEVRCFKCGKWYVTTLSSVNNRLQYLKGNRPNEQNFYCSDKCKNSCSIFGKTPEQVIKEDAVRAGRLPWLELTREVQPELRQMVLKRDEHKCVKCNDSNNLQCHHILPVNIEPLLSADIDNCITLCKECHKEVHKEIDGCGYNQLHIEEC